MMILSIFRNCLLASSFIALCTTTSWAVPVKLPFEPRGNMGGFGYSVIHRAMNRGAIPVITSGGAFCMTTLAGCYLGISPALLDI